MVAAIVVAFTCALAAPDVSALPSMETQVLAGRGATLGRRGPQPTREDRLLNLRAEAEDRLFEVEDRIAEVEGDVQGAGSTTPAQQRELERLRQRQEREKKEIDRLTTALDN